MDESRIELYDDTGKKTSLKAFKTGDVVVARLGQKMSEREFREFIKRQGEVLRIFQSRGITLIFPGAYSFPGKIFVAKDVEDLKNLIGDLYVRFQQDELYI